MIEMQITCIINRFLKLYLQYYYYIVYNIRTRFIIELKSHSKMNKVINNSGNYIYMFASCHKNSQILFY